VVDRAATAAEQLQAALDADEAASVHLQVKHLAKVLGVSQLSAPHQILCGALCSFAGLFWGWLHCRPPSAQRPTCCAASSSFQSSIIHTPPPQTTTTTPGIAANRGHVHIMFIFKDPTSTAAFDDSLELTFKLPVRAEEDEE